MGKYSPFQVNDMPGFENANFFRNCSFLDSDFKPPHHEN